MKQILKLTILIGIIVFSLLLSTYSSQICMYSSDPSFIPGLYGNQFTDSRADGWYLFDKFVSFRELTESFPSTHQTFHYSIYNNQVDVHENWVRTNRVCVLDTRIQEIKENISITRAAQINWNPNNKFRFIYESVGFTETPKVFN